MDTLKSVIDFFHVQGEVENIMPWGNGHINKTYKVECNSGTNYILQGINTQIFTRPDELMENVTKITNYVRQNEENRELVAELIPTKEQEFWIDNEFSVWRMHPFIEGKSSFEVADSEELCEKAGRAYGAFLTALKDFPVDELHIIIPNFHDIRFRLNQFEDTLNQGLTDRNDQAAAEIEMVKEYRSKFIELYESALRNFPVRVTHNDTKLNNVLIGESEMGTVIDLDTVMPGYTFFDVGDALRSMAISTEEDDPNIESITLSKEKAEAFLRGYLSKTEQILTKVEIESLSESGAYMAFIMAIRFLTDYLNGDVYYKTEYPDHNLVRARNQLKGSELFEKW